MEGDKAGVDNDVDDVDPALFDEDQSNARPSERFHGDPCSSCTYTAHSCQTRFFPRTTKGGTYQVEVY